MVSNALSSEVVKVGIIKKVSKDSEARESAMPMSGEMQPRQREEPVQRSWGRRSGQ